MITYGVEQLAVGSSSDFINHSGLKIKEHSSGYMLSSAGFGEEGVECIISIADSLTE